MLNKYSLMKISLVTLMIAQSSAVFAITDAESASLRGVLALGGLAMTTGLTKMLFENKFIDSYSNKTGVRSKEIAAVTGLMGGLFSLGNAIPQCNQLGWKVPVFYLAFKVANSYFVNKYIFANIPNVGEYIAGNEILKTANILKSSESLFYKGRLIAAIAEARNVLEANPQEKCDTLYEKFSDNTKKMMTKEDWKLFCAGSSNANAALAKYDEKMDNELYINPDIVETSRFAAAAVAYCLYEPTKILLRKMFDYPNCMINFSGKYIDRFTSTLIQ